MLNRDIQAREGRTQSGPAMREQVQAARIMSWHPWQNHALPHEAAPPVRWQSREVAVGHAISLFVFRTDDPAWDQAPLTDCLSDAEQARASRFKFAQHARQHRVCRAMVRRILANACTCDAKALPWSQAPQGKPVLTHHTPLHFNVTHSADWVLLATSATVEVGIDMEMLNHQGHASTLDASILSPSEHLGHAEAPANAEQMLRTWVRKEACLKALGVGLTVGMSDLTLTPELGQATLATAPRREASAHGQPLRWLDVPLPHDCAALACLAWQAP